MFQGPGEEADHYLLEVFWVVEVRKVVGIFKLEQLRVAILEMSVVSDDEVCAIRPKVVVLTVKDADWEWQVGIA